MRNRSPRSEYNNGPWSSRTAPEKGQFQALAAGSSKNVKVLREGRLHERVLLELWEGKERGEVVLEIDEGDQGIEACVIASRFRHITPPVAIPLDILFARELSDFTWASLTTEQSNLRRLLRIACREDGPEHKGEPPIPPESGEGTVLQFASPLTFQHLIQKPKFWKPFENLFLEDGKKRAYFMRTFPKGVKKLVVTKVDAGHRLFNIHTLHGSLDIAVCQLFDPHFASQAKLDACHPADARTMVIQYVAKALNCRPKKSSSAARS